MHFDPTINVGTIFEVVAFIGTVIAVIHRFDRLEFQVTLMFDWWKSYVLRTHKEERSDRGLVAEALKDNK